jgi:hypothetical protein
MAYRARRHSSRIGPAIPVVPLPLRRRSKPGDGGGRNPATGALISKGSSEPGGGGPSSEQVR